MLLYKVNNEIARIFNRAVTSEENQYSDDTMGINWNFVQADFYIDAPLLDLELDKAWDFLVSQFNMAPRDRLG